MASASTFDASLRMPIHTALDCGSASARLTNLPDTRLINLSLMNCPAKHDNRLLQALKAYGTDVSECSTTEPSEVDSDDFAFQCGLTQVQLPPGLELPTTFSRLHREMLGRAKQIATGSADDHAVGLVGNITAASGAALGQAFQQATTVQKHDNIISLQAAIGDAPDLGALGALGVPSVGSTWHHMGLCKPCDFVTRGGCRQGMSCKYCHLCGREENRRHKKERKQLVSAARNFQSGVMAQQRQLSNMYGC